MDAMPFTGESNLGVDEFLSLAGKKIQLNNKHISTDNNMLVTVIVITYNSAKYVLETLESVYRQSYNNIELIVSDDCSKDNTVSICQQWVDTNRNRFISAKVIQTENNSGICGNYNFALKNANGNWIKYIAGDDILEDNCIERFVSNIKPNTFLYTCISHFPFVYLQKEMIT